MKKYRWVAESNDRSFEDESRQEFASKEECYNDMRNAALEKMKWNTEFTDCDENDTLGYKVHFSQNKIIHESYSGVYTYEIKEVQEMKTIELTDEQRLMIAESIINMVHDIENVQLEINNPKYDGIEIFEKHRVAMAESKLKYQTLLNYIQQV
jgi:Asp-tRNA(Asn)/Glu-tRNA(Gln) amidotransferase C subunit